MEFYQQVIASLLEAGIPWLVGGAFALRHYTGIHRDTKDLDLFLLAADQERAMNRLAREGYRTEWTAPHWLTKIRDGGHYVDLIFGLANGSGKVTPSWFERSVPGRALERNVRLIPMEEMIWSKGFIMDRDRFDGADIYHLLLAGADSLDWNHLLALFGPHGAVLLSHLILFGYVFPAERGRVPAWVIDRLWQQCREDPAAGRRPELCRGTLLSRSQYEFDLQRRGCADARLLPHGTLTALQAAQ